MSTFLLIALIASAFTIQYRLDVRSIARVASRRGWSETRVRWTPWAPGAALRSRGERCYWLRYRDESGRLARCLCRVANPFHGEFGVSLEPASADEHARGAPLTPPGRLQFCALSVLGGAFLGAALGIGGSFLIFPSSNIAPAYGLILMVPLGVGAGALYGLLGRR